MASHANSTLSQSPSTRYILTDMNSPLDPPSAPFAGSSQASINRNNPYAGNNDNTSSSNISLTVNYLPSKFSSTLLSPGPRKRKGNSKRFDIGVPKRGGGVEAFRNGAARIPGAGDEDEDVSSGWFTGKEGRKTKQKLRWNKFKWTLFISNILVGLSLGC